MDDKLKYYNELLNISTAKYIVKALCDYEDLIKRTETSNNNTIQIVFLFSGPKPDCEYEICKIIKDKIPDSRIDITLVDIHQPNEDSIYITNKKEYGINTVQMISFSKLNLFHKMCPRRFKPNTYIIGIHPQHDALTKKILNTSSSPYKMRSYTSNEIDKILGMYEFFDNCWLNKKILYAFRGNPEDEDNIKDLSLNSIEFKPPVVVIFCNTETEKYIDIQSVFEKGKSIFNLPKNDDELQFNKMTVKDNSTYVYNACNLTQSAGYKKKHSKTKKITYKIKYNKTKNKKNNTKKHIKTYKKHIKTYKQHKKHI
jgi:hypothetical protein